MKLSVEESEFIPCDFLEAFRHLPRHNPPTAILFAEAFKSTVILLSDMPHLGRLRPELGGPEVRSWRLHKFRNYFAPVQLGPALFDCLPEFQLINGIGKRDLNLV